MGLIGGFCHLYIGQEGVISGIEMLAKEKDCFITGYRCHAHMVTRGEPMEKMYFLNFLETKKALLKEKADLCICLEKSLTFLVDTVL